MDGQKGLEWMKEKFDKGKDEVVRLTKVSKLRIEISSLNKKKEDRMLAMGKRVFQLIEEGKISETYFEPDYSGTLQIEGNIEQLIEQIEEINAMSAETGDPVETVLNEEYTEEMKDGPVNEALSPDESETPTASADDTPEPVSEEAAVDAVDDVEESVDVAEESEVEDVEVSEVEDADEPKGEDKK